MRARRESTLLLALTACSAFANVTVEATAQTSPNVASFVAGDPAIGTRIIGTDGSQNNFYVYNQAGVQQQLVVVGLNGSADIHAGLLAVAVPNTGILFYEESSIVAATLPDGGSPLINLSQVSMVALGEDNSGNTLVFANSGGTSISRFVYGGDALTPVSLTGTPRGLAWFDGVLYATIAGAVVAIDSAGVTQNVITDNLGGAQGLAIVSMPGGTYALVASSSDSFVYVHRLSSPAEFVGTFSVTNGAATVSPKYLASNGTTLVLQDSLTANYKMVPLSSVATALGLSTDSDGGTGATDGGPTGGGTGTSGPSGPVGAGSGGAEPISLCGCSAPPLLYVPALFALMLVRRRRRR